MIVKPFAALRPQEKYVKECAALPYDVMSSDEAREAVKGNPYSFLHIDKAEVDLDSSIDLYDERVYQTAANNLKKFEQDGVYIQDKIKKFYFYRQTMGDRAQTGIVGCASIDDYLNNKIKKHELTRADKELDRIRHVDTCSAQTGPIFLAYKESIALDEIIEIQTKGFDKLRHKLEAFLKEYSVTVVHPIVRHKYLHWVDPETGEIVSKRRSPKIGRPTDILPEIYRLPAFQNHPNLSFVALMMDMEEYRLLDGWNKDKKRGSHRMERYPIAIESMVKLQTSSDFAALLPELPEVFTRKNLASAIRMSATTTAYAVRVWERAGSILQVGKSGRQFTYKRSIEDVYRS